LAAERSIDGPPMSMFSMEGLCSKGYRFTQTRSMGGRPSLGAGGHVGRVGAALENAAVDLGVERLDAAVEDFGVAGEGGHIDDGQAGVAQGGGRAAGGEQFHAEGGEAPGEVDQAGFVGNAEKGTLDFHDGAAFFHSPGKMERVFGGDGVDFGRDFP
jgi:hypothetical protein